MRSHSITLTLVSSLAMMACGGDAPPRCVDPLDTVVPDSLCTQQARTRGYVGAGTYGVYRYYYGGSPSAMRGGTVMRGGTSEIASPSSSVSRGVFGRIGRGGGG